MRHTIGVLITYYNEKNMLGECIEAFITGKDKPDEILVYDDASNFKASDFAPRGSPVRIIRGTENRGPSHGRNELLKEASTEYVHFHDVDDLPRPDWCERVRYVIDTKKVDVVFTEISSYGGDRLLCERVLGLERLAAIGDLTRFAVKGTILPSASTLRKDVAVKTGGFRRLLNHSEDFDFHVRLATGNPTHAEILEPLIIKRLRPESRSGSDFTGCWISELEAIRLLSSEIPSKYHKDLAERASRLGTKLFISGSRLEARSAFRMAGALAPLSFPDRHKFYRLAAKALGPENAERLGAVYRKVAPLKLRQSLAGEKQRSA